MNVILLEPDDFLSGTRVRVGGRAARHAREVLRAAPGDELCVGAIDGKLGSGRVERLDEVLEMEVTLDRAPPAPLGVQLVVALPRPPSLRKLLGQATAMGVKRIYLIHSQRVEKSFWQSGALSAESLREQLILGLEQARDTMLPRVELHPRFKPFVEDALPGIAGTDPVFVADLEAQAPPPRGPHGSTTLIIGPEGGFVPYETERLCEHGALRVSLGERPLRVETAVVAGLALLSAC